MEPVASASAVTSEATKLPPIVTVGRVSGVPSYSLLADVEFSVTSRGVTDRLPF